MAGLYKNKMVCHDIYKNKMVCYVMTAVVVIISLTSATLYPICTLKCRVPPDHYFLWVRETTAVRMDSVQASFPLIYISYYLNWHIPTTNHVTTSSLYTLLSS